MVRWNIFDVVALIILVDGGYNLSEVCALEEFYEGK